MAELLDHDHSISVELRRRRREIADLPSTLMIAESAPIGGFSELQRPWRVLGSGGVITGHGAAP